MTYWHMQMFKDSDWGAEKELLEEKRLIGLGRTNDSQTEDFKNKMNVGDIVLVRRGSKPIALVEVIGKVEDYEENDDKKLDWFRYRREVKVLEYKQENMPSFPQPRGTLQKSINKYTRTYQYIDNWYKTILNEVEKGLKIKGVKISDYRIFNNFEISFLDKKQEALPLVILAGKNGTGKTTLLKYIRDYCDGVSVLYDGFYDNSDITDNIIYLDAVIENDNEIEELILAYIDYFIYDRNENAVIGTENLQNDMDEIFDGFDLNFYFKKINYKTKKPIFGNNYSIRDDIEFELNSLSTGEKTLLSKALYLYLKEPKNKVILIDEPETSLHPSWQNKILKFYENFARINNNQIIIATHSPHIIGSANPEYIRVLKKVEDKIEVAQYTQSYGLEFSQILTDIMGVDYLRTPEVAKKMDRVKEMIVQDEYDSAEFKEEWSSLENMLGKKYLDLKLLKLEIASRRKRASNN